MVCTGGYCSPPSLPLSMEQRRVEDPRAQVLPRSWTAYLISTSRSWSSLSFYLCLSLLLLLSLSVCSFCSLGSSSSQSGARGIENLTPGLAKAIGESGVSACPSWQQPQSAWAGRPTQSVPFFPGHRAIPSLQTGWVCGAGLLMPQLWSL